MLRWKIPLSDVDFDAREREAVLRVLESKWLSMGQETEQFEAEFAGHCGVKHAVAVANGTAALHLAMLALGIGPGHAVLQPAVNFVSAANVTMACGATPVFADICSLQEPTVDPTSLVEAVEHVAADGRLSPRAVVVMHYGGYPCRMVELRELCATRKLLLIEDACHGVGGDYSNGGQAIQMGALSDAGCFSFFSNKNLATGEGGMITTQDDVLADRLRRLRSHGMTTLTWDRHRGHASSYDVILNGYNYRIDELRSAIGRAQLAKLDRNNARRRALVERYRDRLRPLTTAGWVIPFDGIAVRGTPSCHLQPLVAPGAAIRNRCAEKLKEQGVQTSMHYPFIPEFTAFRGCPPGVPLERSRAFCTREITLPLYPTMSPEQVDAVAEMVRSAAEA